MQDYDRINNMSVKKIPTKKKKVVNVLFIVSKSGSKPPRIDFYDKGKSVPKDKIKVVFRNSNTGRFVTEKYSHTPHVDKDHPRTHHVNRDSRSGAFITTKSESRHPSTTISERISKDSPIHFRKDSSKK